MVRQRFLSLTGSDTETRGRWDGYRAGSESCPGLLPDGEEMRRLTSAAHGRPLSLVTPLSGPMDLETVLERAAAAAELGWAEVVVNDWGVLNALSGATIGITAGRLLLRARRGPGEFDPWESLDEESRRYFAWGHLYDSPLLDQLREMGVSRIEVDPPRHRLPLPVLEGLAVSWHADFRLVSMSGACPHIEGAGRDPEPVWRSCSGQCLEHGPVLMHAGRLERPLLFAGREILEDARDSWSEEDLPDQVDRIIHSGLAGVGMGNASFTDGME